MNKSIESKRNVFFSYLPCGVVFLTVPLELFAIYIGPEFTPAIEFFTVIPYPSSIHSLFAGSFIAYCIILIPWLLFLDKKKIWKNFLFNIVAILFFTSMLMLGAWRDALFYRADHVPALLVHFLPIIVFLYILVSAIIVRLITGIMKFYTKEGNGR